MKLLIDVCLSPLWVEFLIAAGFECVHWSRIGECWASDAVILEYAAEHRFVVFTNDLDFGALLASRGVRRPSVVQIRTQDVLPSAVGDVVVRALRESAGAIEEGALVTIDVRRNRIRLLPI